MFAFGDMANIARLIAWIKLVVFVSSRRQRKKKTLFSHRCWHGMPKHKRISIIITLKLSEISWSVCEVDASYELSFFLSILYNFYLISCWSCDAISTRWIFMCCQRTRTSNFINLFICYPSIRRCQWIWIVCRIQTRKMPKLVLKNVEWSFHCFDYVYDCWTIKLFSGCPRVRTAG